MDALMAVRRADAGERERPAAPAQLAWTPRARSSAQRWAGAADTASPGRGERSRSPLLFELGGTGHMSILIIIHVLAVEFRMSKCIINLA